MVTVAGCPVRIATRLSPFYQGQSNVAPPWRGDDARKHIHTHTHTGEEERIRARVHWRKIREAHPKPPTSSLCLLLLNHSFSLPRQDANETAYKAEVVAAP